MSPPDRPRGPTIAQLDQDVRSHAKSITEIVNHQQVIDDALTRLHTREAVREVEDKHLDERLDRIEASLRAVYGLGRWILAAVASVLITAVIGFVLNGGPLGGP